MDVNQTPEYEEKKKERKKSYRMGNRSIVRLIPDSDKGLISTLGSTQRYHSKVIKSPSRGKSRMGREATHSSDLLLRLNNEWSHTAIYPRALMRAYGQIQHYPSPFGHL
jgi:hypothetical protein